MRGPQQVHHAGLHDSLRPGRLDGVGQAFEAVADDDQHVLEAPVGELGENAGPVLGALCVGVADPHPQNVLAPVEVDAHRQIRRPVGDMAVSDLDHQRVDEHHRIHAVEGPGAPRLQLVPDPVGHPGYEVVGHLDPVYLFEVGLHVANRHAPGVQGDDPPVEPVQAGAALGDDLGLEGPLPVPGHVQVHGPRLGVQPLGSGPVSGVARPDPRRVAPLIAQVIGQLLGQGPLEHRLGHLRQQAVGPQQIGALGVNPLHERVQHLPRHQRHRFRRHLVSSNISQNGPFHKPGQTSPGQLSQTTPLTQRN